MLSKRTRVVGQWGLVAIFLSLLIYFGDFSDLFRLPTIRWPFIPLIFLSTIGFTLIHNLRWAAIVKEVSAGSQGGKSSFFQLYRWLLDSYALGTVVPGDVSLAGLRTFYMNRSQTLLLPKALFSVLLDRFFDFIIFFLLAFPSALFMTKAANDVEVLLILGCILAGILFSIFWRKGDALNWMMKVYSFGIGRLLKLPVIGRRMAMNNLDPSANASFDERSAYLIMGWSFLKYFLLTLRFYFTGQALGVPFPLFQAIFFIPFIQVVGMLNVTPGGLGIVELGSYGALMLMGVPDSKIMLFVVGQRILLTLITLSLPLMVRLIPFGSRLLIQLLPAKWEE